MKRFAVASILLLALASCTSSDTDQPMPGPSRGPRGGGSGGGFGYRPQAAAGALDMLPPSQWWHDPQLSAVVNLSADQFSSLDKAAKDHEDEIARLERDSLTAAGDVRHLLDADQPAQNDIVAAAQRLRSIRDSAFEHQAQLLAAERTILTKQQWQSLQTALDERRNERRNEGNYGYPGRGRGGRGGRGRYPG